MRVLFWGTPEFATPALRALLGEGFDVAGVVTQPERPRGPEFLAQVEALRPDVSVVVAYGHILPKAVIDLPLVGTLNIHASLLPALRGAAPIQAAIREGLGETGVT